MPEDLDPVTDITEQDGGADNRTDEEILNPEEKPEKTPSKEESDVTPPPERGEERKPKPEKEEDEEEEEEEEETEEEEEQEEDQSPLPSPEYKDVIKKFPTLFKEFPGLRHDFFRVKAYDKIFTSVDEAREVASQYDGYQELGKVLENGNSEALLANLAKFNKASMTQLATSFLPALYKTDPQTFGRISSDVLARTLRAAQSQAKSSGNKNLYYATEHLSMFLWDKKDVPEDAPNSSPEIEEQKRLLDERERKFFEARHTEFVTDVKDTGERILRKEISRGLDPDGVLPDIVKEAILERVMDDVDTSMGQDEQHVRNMNALWERAARMGHGKDFKNRLIQAYVSRARSLVGPIRRKLVGEAVAKISKRSTGAQGETTPRKAVPGGRTPSGGGKTPSPKDVDWSTTSDLDYLNRNITKRK